MTAPVEVDDYRCCSLDKTGGGHGGPCGRPCPTCAHDGVCPGCGGAGPELAGCPPCDTTGTCPERCDEGWVWDQ